MTPTSEIIDRIDKHTVETETDEMRDWLGASEIGEKCVRKLWYSFRHCGKEKFSPRMLRLFARGHREEDVFDRLLMGANFIVRRPDRLDKELFQFSDCSDHFRGTADGAAGEGNLAAWAFGELAEDTVDWFMLEFKTYADETFLKLKRTGIREQNPKYFAQMQTYMGELGFDRCLFCAVNKNDDDLYFEWVEFDQLEFEKNLNKAETVINAQSPPQRISNDPESFYCRYCHFKSICHENTPPLKNCRSCVNARPAEKGTWSCSKRVFGTVCPEYQAITG